MLWVGLLTAMATFGAFFLLLVLATRVDRSEFPIVGDGSLLGRDDVRQDFESLLGASTMSRPLPAASTLIQSFERLER
jgi:hypothetical protein